MTSEELLKLFKSNPRLALAKAITLIESTNAEHLVEARKLLEAINPFRKDSIRIGISGIPGVGKSTFIEAFGSYLLSIGKKVAVLTIDPSSPISGGSVLGDKTRMSHLAMSENAFIRPSPSNCELGGVTSTTRKSIFLCEYAGFDIILVETVGIELSEVTLASMTDVFVQLHMPSTGDELQGMKKGIMEMSDLIVVTKADGDLLRAAEISKNEIELSLHLSPVQKEDTTAVLLASGKTKSGIETIYSAIEDLVKRRSESGRFKERRKSQNKEWFMQEVEKNLLLKFKSHKNYATLSKDLISKIEANKITPMKASDELIAAIFEN